MKLKLFITAIVAVAAFSPGHAGSKAKNDCNITINDVWTAYDARSEEHTSELQSQR